MAAGAEPDEIIIDIDATLVDAHYDKADATPTYKRGFGLYPILAHLDETGEALAGMLRPGRAGSNDAADHLGVLDASLARLPIDTAKTEVLVRTDSAGATHDLIDARGDLLDPCVECDEDGPVLIPQSWNLHSSVLGNTIFYTASGIDDGARRMWIGVVDEN